MAENPFTPTFGVSPPLLAGRDGQVEAFVQGLRDGVGAAERVTLVTGLRGTGKTVMLNAYEDAAHELGWLVISETASNNLVDRITNTALPQLLAEHDPDQTRSRLTNLSFGGWGGGRDVTERHPVTPTLRTRMTRLAQVLRPGSGVLVTVDELHRHADLSDLANTLQHLRREGLNFAFAGAGLPSSVDRLLADDKPLTFLRRADRQHLGAVSLEETSNALAVPIQGAGKRITPDALQRAAAATNGYPFMIQLIGSSTWRASGASDTITAAHAQAAVDTATRRVGQLVHDPALADLSATDRSFLVAMAQDATGPSLMRDITQRMGTDTNNASQYRLRLIAAEIIEPTGHGAVDFTLPYLREHLRTHATSLLHQAGFPAPAAQALPPPRHQIAPGSASRQSPPPRESEQGRH